MTASTIIAGSAAKITTLNAAPIIMPITPMNNAANIATTVQ